MLKKPLQHREGCDGNCLEGSPCFGGVSTWRHPIGKGDGRLCEGSESGQYWRSGGSVRPVPAPICYAWISSRPWRRLLREGSPAQRLVATQVDSTSGLERSA